jgi:plasmid stability protein
MTKPQDDFIKTAIRLPRDLHADILESAAHHGRSMNAEMLARLSSQAGATLDDIARQNVRTQEMVQTIIEALGSGNGRSGT